MRDEKWVRIPITFIICFTIMYIVNRVQKDNEIWYNKSDKIITHNYVIKIPTKKESLDFTEYETFEKKGDYNE